jgi:hypothetical protein
MLCGATGEVRSSVVKSHERRLEGGEALQYEEIESSERGWLGGHVGCRAPEELHTLAACGACPSLRKQVTRHANSGRRLGTTDLRRPQALLFIDVI